MNLAITGVGLLTSVGRDATTACASIRAGVSRPVALPIPFSAEVDGDPLTGHPVAGYTDGFFFVGRWMRLVLGALADLEASAALPKTEGEHVAFWDETVVVLALPEIADRYAPYASSDADEVGRDFLTRLFELAGLGPAPPTALVCPLDHAGALVGIARALHLFEAGPLRRALVIAVDALVDAPSIEWMVRRGELQPDAPGGGVQPGEAAACLLLERDADAATAITGLAVGVTPERGSLDASVEAGRQIGQTIGACLAASGLALPFAGDIVADLTGASWRAKELGAAFVTLGPERLAPETALVLPGTSTGDTGSASAVIALAVASRALARGYARSAASLVLARSPSGAHGAAVVARAAHISRSTISH